MALFQCVLLCPETGPACAAVALLPSHSTDTNRGGQTQTHFHTPVLLDRSIKRETTNEVAKDYLSRGDNGFPGLKEKKKKKHGAIDNNDMK